MRVIHLKGLLDVVKDNTFSIAVDDSSSKVSMLNTRCGLSKISYVLNELGVDGKPFSFFGPDAGITRNYERWASGFGYGCVISWPDRELAFPEMKPNGCGMIVSKIGDVPDIDELSNRILRLSENPPTLMGMEVEWDAGDSNHFIEVLRVEDSSYSGLQKGDICALLHTSASEMKDLMYDFDRWVDSGGRWIETPVGEILVLMDSLSKEYYKEYKKLEEFSKKKREIIFDNIFDQHEVICNPTHQGLFKENEIRLGLYDSTDGIFPISLRPDLPVYLVEGNKNIKPELIPPNIPEWKREQIEGINVLPHGGGYQLKIDTKNLQMSQKNGTRLFKTKTKGREYLFTNPSQIPYNYRGKEVLDKIFEWDLGQPVVKMEQKYTVKI
ncbi:RNA-splicing ligase RtcB family [Methanonatronarchaeum thermophilum]|uniref:RNA-splicing ligase RtcB family n=1 Tax=Methanonatronarchaeum thermophilum TaxID=1927129 RepID=A0A1Y3GBJ3_9EURY|nr:hypothetical protein [Methanonatronarchaeum thermophilum]OUJ18610.1 RNA-splicing ligase RtcB family [Methanonatronarchaeum thermophilum]